MEEKEKEDRLDKEIKELTRKKLDLEIKLYQQVLKEFDNEGENHGEKESK